MFCSNLLHKVFLFCGMMLQEWVGMYNCSLNLKNLMLDVRC